MWFKLIKVSLREHLFVQEQSQVQKAPFLDTIRMSDFHLDFMQSLRKYSFLLKGDRYK